VELSRATSIDKRGFSFPQAELPAALVNFFDFKDLELHHSLGDDESSARLSTTKKRPRRR